jgi:hypothetical protein
MGIAHFTGLGKSPGAVTSGLSYLKEEYGDREEYGKIVEKVVLFTSSEVVEGRVKAIHSVCNEYMRRTVQKSWADRLDNPVEIVKEFLAREFTDVELYVCTLDVNDFSACFEAVAKVLLKFHPPGQVGKHVFANITGSTNILNAAILHVAYLSGLIPIIYYTFIRDVREDGKFLKPFSRDPNEFRFRLTYVFKTNFDLKYKYLLEVLEESKHRWLPVGELLTRLKDRHPLEFLEVDETTLIRDFLNIIPGIDRRGDSNKINQEGERMLAVLRSPLFEILTRSRPYTQRELEELVGSLNLVRYM